MVPERIAEVVVTFESEHVEPGAFETVNMTVEVSDPGDFAHKLREEPYGPVSAVPLSFARPGLVYRLYL